MTKETEFNERYRPQFHFSAKENWLNDPNGCVFHDGNYHLFFQHNPAGREWGNMTWGHATSPDLMHWRQLPDAILPYENGTIYSGSAAVDAGNRSGFGSGNGGALVAAFTHARKPFSQAIAYSNDQGVTWNLYNNGKPVVPNQGLDEEERDPKILWHAPSRKWIMALWVKLGCVRFFTSDNLKHWNHASDFVADGFYECPDLFELPVDGDTGTSKWVLHDAAFNYWIGSFDGKTFLPELGPIQGDFGRNFYAAQTWNNTGNRVIQIAWMRGGDYPGMPFNQQMSFPCELSLKTTPQGIRLCRMPVKEIATLYVGSDSVDNHALTPGKTLEIGLPGDLFDVELEAAVPLDSSFSIRLGGQDITYSEGRIQCLGKEADLLPSHEVVSLRILADRTSIELFGSGGEVSMSSCFLPPDKTAGVQLRAKKGVLHVRRMTVHRLSSAWEIGSNKPNAGDA